MFHHQAVKSLHRRGGRRRCPTTPRSEVTAYGACASALHHVVGQQHREPAGDLTWGAEHCARSICRVFGFRTPSRFSAVMAHRLGRKRPPALVAGIRGQSRLSEGTASRCCQTRSVRRVGIGSANDNEMAYFASRMASIIPRHQMIPPRRGRPSTALKEVTRGHSPQEELRRSNRRPSSWLCPTRDFMASSSG
jgi:hypothetical protein